MLKRPTDHMAEDTQPTFTFDGRHWRVRGLEKQLSSDRLRVTLHVSRGEFSFVDTIDLYLARRRRAYAKEAAAELFVEEQAIKQDLGRLLNTLEEEQQKRIRSTLTEQEPEVPEMTDRQRDEALAMLRDPQLVDRILSDYEICGLVGEETSKLVCYLACVSRHLRQPLGVLIQSSSAAGKTTLQDTVLRFMPPDEQVALSAVTGQSLYYMPRDALKHKILSVAEEDGVTHASYALKLLQSDGRLAIACVGRDPHTGRQQTQCYEVEGPVSMILTTTEETPHTELINRCLVVSANEQPQQTAAIHQRQRVGYGSEMPDDTMEDVITRHQNAQRLLKPLRVVIPWAEQLTFRADQVRFRRDHAKYLSLIASITLLHQYQREQECVRRHGEPETYVKATLDDIELANRLATEVLAEHVDSLMPRTRRLLDELYEYVVRRAEVEGVSTSEVRFTQRQLREALERGDRAIRTHLQRLVTLEYVAWRRTGCGNQREYRLLCEPGETPSSLVASLGLVDVDKLRKGTAPASQPLIPQACESAIDALETALNWQAKTSETMSSDDHEKPH